GPPLAWLVQRVQAPQGEHYAEDQPHSAVPVHEDMPAQGQPRDYGAQQYEYKLNRDPQEPLWRQHGRAFALDQAMRSMRNFWMTTGVRGRSFESRCTFEILLATSWPSTTSPKMVCRLSSHGV